MSLIKFNTSKPAINPFDQIFSDFFEGEFFPSQMGKMRNGSVPAANIKENDKAYMVELAAPGMKKEDFKVEINDDLLSIRSESKHENEESNERFTKREWNYTSFVRSFRLPEEVEAEKISASYRDGVLHIEIPKAENITKNKVREINIK